MMARPSLVSVLIILSSQASLGVKIRQVDSESSESSFDRADFCFFHDGHCDGGWLVSNTQLSTKEECATLCSSTTSCGYFAWSTSPSNNCALYDLASGCPDDNTYPTYNAYSMGPCAASSSGDPHMVNMFGEKFDVLKRGMHVLIQIPQGADPQHTLLRVEANVTGGKLCNYTFIKNLNITGQWTKEHRPGWPVARPDGFQYAALSHGQRAPQEQYDGKLVTHKSHLNFGEVKLMIAYGKMVDSGLTYLNFRVKNLHNVTEPVGGLLGLDDYKDVSSSATCTPDPEYADMSHAEQLEAGDVTMGAV